GLGLINFYHYYNLLDRSSFDIGQNNIGLTSEFGEDSLDDEGENVNDAYEEIVEATPDEIIAIEEDLENNIEDMASNSELYNTDCFNLLLIGVDSRSNNYSGRSDVMILVSINKETKRVVMTSILRDTFVSIPGNGTNRLNAAYAYGGEDLLVETIKANFGIDVDRCAIVNFYVVMDLVNAVGGVDIELSSDEIKVMNKYYIEGWNYIFDEPKGTDIIDESLAGTTVHLNGKQALAYARVRYVGTDFARTARQREVIMLCLEKIKGMSLSELDTLAEELLPKIRTNLTESDCASLLLMALNISSYSFDNMTIPIEGSWSNVNIRGMSVLAIDFQKNTEAWFNLVQGE
ncbi:MAG: LCP family protein, partial [Lachnospiraceae bacterium]|nr:LCP family protein [Lachnospiraceae bacterium]